MIDYRLDLVTAPTKEPVTVTEAKAFLRITGDTEDTLIASLITVARSAAESYTRRAFITQTWKMFRDDWPTTKGNRWWDGVRQLPISELRGQGVVVMPLPPLQSVTHIKTYDDADAATTFSTGNYQVSAYSGDFANQGRITLRDSGSGWPTFERNADGVEIQFGAGYGDDAADIPGQIRQAIKHQVSTLYEDRGACEGGACCNITKKLLDPFRIIKL